MKKLLEFLITSIVKNPTKVKINENPQGNEHNFAIKVHPDDIKIIIGKKGRTIKAIRDLIRIKSRKKVNITIQK